MAKDSLARGAKSATFSAGRAKKDDPIEFHGTVATEENESPIVESDESWQASEALNKLRNAHASDELIEMLRNSGTRYEPLYDRVLVKRIEEEQQSLIAQPDAFRKKPTCGLVLAVGPGMVMQGRIVPIPLQPGDVVYFGEYGPEDFELEGEKFTSVSAFDIRFKDRVRSHA